MLKPPYVVPSIKDTPLRPFPRVPFPKMLVAYCLGLNSAEDESGVKGALSELVQKSRAEESCIYYGWTRAGSKLFCREGYTSADGILAHLVNVSTCGGLTKFAKPYRIEIHGPKAEIAKLKDTADKMGAVCYERSSGFQHFQAKASLALARTGGDGLEQLKKMFLRLASVLKYFGLGGHAVEIFLALIGRLAYPKP